MGQDVVHAANLGGVAAVGHPEGQEEQPVVPPAAARAVLVGRVVKVVDGAGGRGGIVGWPLREGWMVAMVVVGIAVGGGVASGGGVGVGVGVGGGVGRTETASEARVVQAEAERHPADGEGEALGSSCRWCRGRAASAAVGSCRPCLRTAATAIVATDGTPTSHPGRLGRGVVLQSLHFSICLWLLLAPHACGVGCWLLVVGCAVQSPLRRAVAGSGRATCRAGRGVIIVCSCVCLSSQAVIVIVIAVVSSGWKSLNRRSSDFGVLFSLSRCAARNVCSSHVWMPAMDGLRGILGLRSYVVHT